MIEQAIAAGAATSVFNGESQHNRLLSIDFPRNDGPDEILLVNTLIAREEISRCFRFEVELLSDNARIPLRDMMGLMVTISLVRLDGSLRYFNGYVTEFRFLRTDGGFAFYRMLLEPWLAKLRLHTDCVSFLGKSVIEITEATFHRYYWRSWRNMLCEEYPRLTYANQYNESDYNHLHRRWEAAGFHYWYEHTADGHMLMLSDRSTISESVDPPPEKGDGFNVIAYCGNCGSISEDGIRHWQAIRRTTSGSMTLTSYDYKHYRPQRTTAHSTGQLGRVPTPGIHLNTGSDGFPARPDGEALARLRMEEHERDAQTFEAAGDDRDVQPGRSFKLFGHFSGGARDQPRDADPKYPIDDRLYLIVAVVHTASNNYIAGAGAGSHYENKFECLNRVTRWRPGIGYNSVPVPDPGVQTAIVVGPEGEEIYTDGFGRVKIQFHWDREGTSNGYSSAWVRVSMPAAGNQFGHMALPRIGQEVVVQYLDGNVDHPIITGVVYSARSTPPWKLPEQRTLSGIRSKEFGGERRSNQLVMDDTTAGIQTQLRSDHAASQLSLGHIHRVDGHAGRKEARGEGFELASDAWGVLRAGKGMLITTEARARLGGECKSMDETIELLAGSKQHQDRLSRTAHEHGISDGPGEHVDQGAALDAISKQNEAIKATGAAMAELSSPHLVIASPAGIETASRGSTHIASAEHTGITAGKSLSIATADSFLANVGAAFRVFVHKAGMRLIAASGKVSIQSQSDELEIVAKKVLSLISEADWVDIKARKGIRLQGAHSMIEISDKVQVFSAVPTLFHGNLETLPPKNAAPQAARAASALVDTPATAEDVQTLRHVVQTHPGGPVFSKVPYTLYKGESKVEDGITDDSGEIRIDHVKGTPNYRIVLGNGEEFNLCVVPELAKSGDPMYDEHFLGNQGNRAFADTTESRRKS